MKEKHWLIKKREKVQWTQPEEAIQFIQSFEDEEWDNEPFILTCKRLCDTRERLLVTTEKLCYIFRALKVLREPGSSVPGSLWEAVGKPI